MIRMYAEHARSHGEQVVVLSDHVDYKEKGHGEDRGITILYLSVRNVLKLLFSDRKTVCVFEPNTTYLFAGLLLKFIRPSRVLSLFFVGTSSITQPWKTHIVFQVATRFTDRFLALSDYVKEILSSVVPSERIDLCHNPVTVDAYTRSRLVGKRLVNVDRVVAGKNHVAMVRAFVKVAKEEPAATLTIAGNYKKVSDPSKDSESHRQAMEIVRRESLEDRVTFLGDQNPDQVKLLLSTSDLFLKTSRSETCGISTIEAMASGLPVVAFDNTGTHETVSHGRGILVPDGDVDAMARAILQVLSNSAEMQQLGNRARAGAFFYDTQKCVPEFFHLITSKKG